MNALARRALFVTLAIVTACTSPAGVTPPASTAPTTAAPTTTTVTIDTTTSTTTTTTTTTTLPPLDRSDQATADRMQADLDVLLFNGPRVSGTWSEAAAADYFAQTAADITGVASRLQTVPLPTGTTSVNVWASTVGSGDSLLLVGAHLDSVAGSPGADDNGSGVVLLLELLRRLAEEPPTSLRVVVVGFGAEEYIGDSGHHFGSRLAVDEMEVAGMLPDLMLSVDMVGIGSELYSVDFQSQDPSFADEVVVAATAAGIEVGRKSRGEISDHVAFTRAGVPAAHLLRGDNSDFHSPGDDSAADEALLATLRVIEAVIYHLSATGQSPPP